MNNIKKSKLRPMSDFDVIFTDKGDLCYRAHLYGTNKSEKNHLFSDNLEYTGYTGSSGGNSHIMFKSLNSGRNYHMFMSDFDQVIQEKRFIDNQIIGVFCFCKKGTTQGIRLTFEP